MEDVMLSADEFAEKLARKLDRVQDVALKEKFMRAMVQAYGDLLQESHAAAAREEESEAARAAAAQQEDRKRRVEAVVKSVRAGAPAREATRQEEREAARRAVRDATLRKDLAAAIHEVRDQALQADHLAARQAVRDAALRADIARAWMEAHDATRQEELAEWAQEVRDAALKEEFVIAGHAAGADALRNAVLKLQADIAPPPAALMQPAQPPPLRDVEKADAGHDRRGEHLRRTSLSTEALAAHERELRDKLDAFFTRIGKRVVPAMARDVARRTKQRGGHP